MLQSYIVVMENNDSDLSVNVNNQMKVGYEPIGGIAVHRESLLGTNHVLYQAMILTRKDGKPNPIW